MSFIKKEASSYTVLYHMKFYGIDEEKVVVDDVSNRRNTRVITKHYSCVPPVMQSKNPASVKVFGAVGRDGKVMPLTSEKQA